MEDIEIARNTKLEKNNKNSRRFKYWGRTIRTIWEI